jgi:hypothetical protein
MKKLCFTFALVASMASPTLLHATALFGTFGFNFQSVTVSPPVTNGHFTPLDPSTGILSINFGNPTLFAGPGSSTPDFPDPTTGAITGSSKLYPNSINGGNGGPFTLTFGTYGTFTEVGPPILVTETASPETLSLLLNGIFTPGPYFAGLIGGPSTIVTTFNESIARGQASYSGSGTFAIDNSATIPEPSGLILLGTGMLGVVGALRLRSISR